MTSAVAAPPEAVAAGPPDGRSSGITPDATVDPTAMAVTTTAGSVATASVTKATAQAATTTTGEEATGTDPIASADAMPPLSTHPMPAPPIGGGRGIRVLVRDHRMTVLRRVLEEAGTPLSFDEVARRTLALDGVGIPRRTLFEAPFFEVVTAQAPRRGRLGALSGLPWRLRRLSPVRRGERTAELVTRRDALAALVDTAPGEAPAADDAAARAADDAPTSAGSAAAGTTAVVAADAGEAADEAAASSIRTMLALEAEIAAFERGRGADAARAMLDRLVARRAEAAATAAARAVPSPAVTVESVSAARPAPAAAPTGPRS